MPEAFVASRPSWRPERRGFDPAMKRMAVVALALALGMGLGIGAWGLVSRAPAGLPVVEAASGPVRVKPENPGGMQVAGSDDAGPAGTVEKLAPPPEQPQIAALRAQLRAAQRALAKEKQQVAVARIAPVAPAPIPAPAAPKPAAMMAVQLGSFASEAAARAAWSAALARAPALLAGRTPVLVRTDLAGRPAWGLRTGGFPGPREAAAFCARLRDSGAECVVAAP